MEEWEVEEIDSGSDGDEIATAINGVAVEEEREEPESNKP